MGVGMLGPVHSRPVLESHQQARQLGSLLQRFTLGSLPKSPVPTPPFSLQITATLPTPPHFISLAVQLPITLSVSFLALS